MSSGVMCRGRSGKTTLSIPVKVRSCFSAEEMAEDAGDDVGTDCNLGRLEDQVGS